MRTTLLSLMLIAFAFGCGSTVPPPVEPRNDPWKPSQIMFDSERLRRDTAVATPVVLRDEAGILRVQVPIRSTSNLTLYVDYRVTWFDKNGKVINRLGPFTRTLDPNTPDSIQVNATTPEAADFQIDFRYAR